MAADGKQHGVLKAFTPGDALEKDPNSVEQHAVGAKLDFGKPAPLLCLTDFESALRQMVGHRLDFCNASSSLEDACASIVIDEMLSARISSRVLLASMIALQAQSGRINCETMNLRSIHGVVSSFPEALLAVSMLTAIGARKYRPSGWKDVPHGINRYSEACARHFLRSFFEKDDPDTGASHWCCVAWNAAAVLTLQSSGTPSAT